MFSPAPGLGPLCWELSPALPQLTASPGRLALPSSFRWPWIPHVPETTHIPYFAKNGKNCLRHLAGWLQAVTCYFGAAQGCVQWRDHSLHARGAAGSVPRHHPHPWPSWLTLPWQPSQARSCGQTDPVPVSTIAPWAPQATRWRQVLRSQLQRKSSKMAFRAGATVREDPSHKLQFSVIPCIILRPNPSPYSIAHSSSS